MDLDAIRHKIKLKYGLPPAGPTDEEFKCIVRKLGVVYQRDGVITETAIDDAVNSCCRGVGSHKYLAQSHADLRAAFAALIDELK